MTRSIWKGPYIDSYIFKFNHEIVNKSISKKVIKIWSRNSIILPNFVGLKVQIYNGKKFLSLKIISEMVGHKFGEFGLTRQMSPKMTSLK